MYSNRRVEYICFCSSQKPLLHGSTTIDSRCHFLTFCFTKETSQYYAQITGREETWICRNLVIVTMSEKYTQKIANDGKCHIWVAFYTGCK